jgi:hypothetical protein|tara:strand:+ start:793 stop:927 length:135 start_codon:yes stop_codon:yes gene_type:complete
MSQLTSNTPAFINKEQYGKKPKYKKKKVKIETFAELRKPKQYNT